MKKNVLLVVFLMFNSLTYAGITKTVNLNVPGTLTSTLNAAEKLTVESLAISGNINAADFKCMRDELIALSELDLINVTISAFSGNGTNGVQEYPAHEIPDFAFHNGYEGGGKLTLERIYFPLSLQRVGNNAFFECVNLTGGLHFTSALTSIGNSAFKNCTKLNGVLTLGQGVVSIGNSAFENCKFTGDLVLPASLTSINNAAFRNCKGFSGKLVLSSSLTSIKPYVFDGCSGLTGPIDLPTGLLKIEGNAFSGCNGLTGQLKLPSTLTSIGSYAFKDCSGLTGDVIIPEGLTVIGDYSFMNCTGLNGSLTLSSTVRSIMNGAFYNCTSLSGILLFPTSVTTIGGSAFKYCVQLEELCLPGSITSIMSSAFDSCVSLSRIAVAHATPLVINAATFKNVNTNECILEIPVGSGDLYANALVWQNFRQRIENNVTAVYEVNVQQTSNGSVLLNDQLFENNQTAFIARATVLQLLITPDSGYLVNKVVVNNTDVTDELANNSLILPKLYQNLEVKITFSPEDDLRTETETKVHSPVKIVRGVNCIVVEGVKFMEEIKVYTSNGQLRYLGKMSEERHIIPVTGNDVWIVCVPGMQFQSRVIM